VKNKKATVMSSNLIKTFMKFHVFSILCGIGIFILCTIRIPPQDEIPQFPNFDKFVHFMMYFALSTAVILETLNAKSGLGKALLRAFIAAIIVSAIFGGLIEFIQSGFTNYRSGDIMDWVFDLAGSVSSCLLIGLIRLAFR